MKTPIAFTPGASRLPLLLAAFALLAVTLGCQLFTQQGSGSPANPGGRTSSPQTLTSGEFDLLDPAAELDTLDAYTVHYTKSFDGKVNGETRQTTVTITRIVSGGQVSVLMETTAPDGTALYHHSVWLDGDRYVQEAPGAACRLAPGARPDLDPGRTLPALSGGEDLGEDSSLGEPARHYRFEQRMKEGSYSADVWVDEAGGYVLRYDLQKTIDSGGVEGREAIAYELSPGVDEAPALPEGCLVAPAVPVMDGAAELVRQPGLLRYYSGASLEEAVSFYQDAMPGEGWQGAAGQTGDTTVIPGSKGQRAELTFTREHGSGRQLAVIVLQPGDKGLEVRAQVFLLKQAAVSQTTPEADEPTEEPEANATPRSSATPGSPSGGAVDLTVLPQYPGAKNPIYSAGFITFTTGDPADVVATFYHDAMEELGWVLVDEESAGDMLIQEWSVNGVDVNAMYIPANGETAVMIGANTSTEGSD